MKQIIKVIARQVVPQYDFAAFDFDAEKVNTDKDYLIIYVNREKRKVKKSAVKFVFEPGNRAGYSDSSKTVHKVNKEMFAEH